MLTSLKRHAANNPTATFWIGAALVYALVLACAGLSKAG
jgi:hypothetical protein